MVEIKSWQWQRLSCKIRERRVQTQPSDSPRIVHGSRCAFGSFSRFYRVSGPRDVNVCIRMNRVERACDLVGLIKLAAVQSQFVCFLSLCLDASRWSTTDFITTHLTHSVLRAYLPARRMYVLHIQYKYNKTSIPLPNGLDWAPSAGRSLQRRSSGQPRPLWPSMHVYKYSGKGFLVGRYIKRRYILASSLLPVRNFSFRTKSMPLKFIDDPIFKMAP